MSENSVRPSITFDSGSSAIAEDALHIRLMKGYEAISKPYRFELDLLAAVPDIDLDEALDNTAVINMRQPVKLSGDSWGTKVLPIHGELSEFTFVKRTDQLFEYRAVLVPRFWKLNLNHASRIFQEKSVMEIVTEVLSEYGLDTEMEDTTDGGNSDLHPTREYVVQYEESDFDFVSRWLEAEGIFYFFRQTESGEKIVFADATAGYRAIEQPSTVRFNDRMQAQGRIVDGDDEQATFYREPVIGSLSRTKVRRQQKVVLNDYNWRTPTVSLVSEVDADADHGVGMFYEFNAHFKNEAEGAAVAQVRAEEIMCRVDVFNGTSDFRSFHAGHTFGLEEHYVPDFNHDYLLIEVEHEAEQVVGTTGMRMISPHSARYENRFKAIHSETIFRPKSVTPWPSIAGFINATIDAGGSGQYAEIDDMGRYKVVFPFDLSGNSGGGASRYVRMAQPYSGGGMGMHFPLHKGTEVLISFVDGDPDRPVIMGSVPNAETLGPVTGGNQTQCAIHTGGGNQLVIEDTDGTQSMTLSSPGANTIIAIGKS